MSDLLIDGIEDIYFRANPAYRLTLLEQLSENQRESVEDISKDPDFYAFLVPRQQSGLTIKSIDQDTALLYSTLKRPSVLPLYVRNSLGKDLNKTVSILVFKGILEARVNGNFVSGADAFDKSLFETEKISGENFRSTVNRLSVEALKYAQALDINNIPKLAARLYLYNFQPLTPSLKKQFPTTESLSDFLGIGSGGKLQALLNEYETNSIYDAPDKYWTIWKSPQAGSENKNLTYKLYVSPDYRILPEVLPLIFEPFIIDKVACFKMGKDLRGILRPDKIVAYFENLSKLRNTAEKLQSKLAGYSAQGVPFTANISDEGFISWAIDPPKSENIFNFQQEDSWRTWIVKRLSAAIIEAKINCRSAQTEPWQYALESVRLQGVDVQNWLPVDAFSGNEDSVKA